VAPGLRQRRDDLGLFGSAPSTWEGRRGQTWSLLGAGGPAASKDSIDRLIAAKDPERGRASWYGPRVHGYEDGRLRMSVHSLEAVSECPANVHQLFHGEKVDYDPQIGELRRYTTSSSRCSAPEMTDGRATGPGEKKRTFTTPPIFY